MKTDREIRELVRKMPLKDRIALGSGKNFWETKEFREYGIPSLFMCDGPHGLRKQEGKADMLGVNNSRPATCFPAEVTTAASWDPELLERVGSAIAEEARAQGVGLVLGPGVNIKRNPLCGRNFEYFSEDPYLAGKLAAGYIRGAEAEGVGTSLKHFAANSQEYMRFTSDSIMDERTLREIYLRGFEIAVKEGGPSSVMCAYPKLNGIHCSDNRKLLTDILRKEWGFTGMVVTDWGAMNDRIEGYKAGCDLNMPGGSNYMEKECLRAVAEGTLSEDDVNASAQRILHLVFHAEQTGRSTEEVDEGRRKDMNQRHRELARSAAEEGAVLLKNEDHILPLAKEDSIALIGDMAKHMRFQGSGSSHINPTALDEPADSVTYESFSKGYDRDGSSTDELIAEAVQAAGKCAKAVIFAGLPESYESEGFDRQNMQMPEGENRLIEAVVKANPDTVVVLFSGSAVECPWADRVKAILYMGLPGQAGGAAVGRLLAGEISPSGKLAESWPYCYEDCVSSGWYGKEKDALYREGIYVGYRYYGKAGIDVRFPFGFGLSYTEFTYSDLKIEGMKVSCTVTNSGDRDGAEIVQLYIGQKEKGLYRPARELKHFARVELKAGESRRVLFELDSEDFAVWQDGWVVPEGIYQVSVGASVADIRLSDEVFAAGEKESAAVRPTGFWYSSCQGIPSVEDFEEMSGIRYRPERHARGNYTMDDSVAEMRKDSMIMKIMYKAVENTIAKGFDGKKDYQNPEFRMLMASSAGGPLRSMQISGGIKGGLMKGLLCMANGHFLKGMKTMIQGE